MMKGLVISSTERILKQIHLYNDSFFQFDVLILSENETYDFGDIDDQFLFSSSGRTAFKDSMGPDEKDRKSSAKDTYVQSLQIDVQKKLILLNSFEAVSHQQSNLAPIKHSSEIFRFKDVIDLKHAKQENLFFLELQSQRMQRYDFLVLENSSYAAEILLSKNINLFIKQTKNLESEFVGFRFKTLNIHSDRKFWRLKDEFLNSLDDNIYFINMTKNFIDIWSFVPCSHVHNKDMQNYWSQRFVDSNEEVLDFLKIQRSDFEFLRQPFQSKNYNPVQKKNLFGQSSFQFRNNEKTIDEITSLKKQIYKHYKKIIEKSEKFEKSKEAQI